jgi:hypothetical protein
MGYDEEEERPLRPLERGEYAPSSDWQLARAHRERFTGEYVLVSCAVLAVLLILVASVVGALSPSTGSSELGRVLGAAAQSGVAGGISMIVNVFAFMWLRTTVNYQQAHVAVGAAAALRELYADGGIRRFYRGLAPALLQGPLCRFGDTAANAGIASLLRDSPYAHESVRALVVTVCAALLSSGWRLLITPIDTLKTSLQVSGDDAQSRLWRKMERHGPCVLWDGGYGAAVASAVGYVPWFLTYNTLDAALPAARARSIGYVLRNSTLGLCASVVSDVCSSGVRVVKVVKQTSAAQLSYREALEQVMRVEGAAGLFRGLGTKLVANAMQACLFSVVWRLLRDAMAQAR